MKTKNWSNNVGEKDVHQRITLIKTNQEVFVGEPPEKELSSLLRVLLKTQTNQEFIHLF